MLLKKSQLTLFILLIILLIGLTTVSATDNNNQDTIISNQTMAEPIYSTSNIKEDTNKVISYNKNKEKSIKKKSDSNNTKEATESIIYVNSKATGDGSSRDNPTSDIYTAINKLEDEGTLLFVTDEHEDTYDISWPLQFYKADGWMDTSVNHITIAGEEGKKIIFTNHNRLNSSIFITFYDMKIDMKNLIIKDVVTSNTTASAIHNIGCDLTLTNVTIENCSITPNIIPENENNENIDDYLATGTIYTEAPLTINNCNFINNTVDSNGYETGEDPEHYGAGGVINFYDTNIVVNNSRFISNRAYTGGSIYAWNEEDFESIIENSVFDNNYAENAAVINNYAGIIRVKNSTFTNNYANNSYPVEKVVTGDVIFDDDCKFNNNTDRKSRLPRIQDVYASSFGSGTGLTKDDPTSLQDAMENLVANGGTIHLVTKKIRSGTDGYEDEDVYTEFSLDISPDNGATQYSFNITGEEGKRIIFRSKSDANVFKIHGRDLKVNFTNIIINDCRTFELNGTAMWIDESTVFLNNVLIENVSTYASHHIGRNASHGPVAYGNIYNTGKLFVNNCSFINNQVNYCAMEWSYRPAQAGVGGAIYNGESSKSYIYNSTFKYNRAYEAGAIYYYSLSDEYHIIDNCLFDTQGAWKVGVLGVRWSKVNITNTIFTKNIANYTNQIAHGYMSEMNFENCKFDSNKVNATRPTSLYKYGAFFLEYENNITFNKCNFTQTQLYQQNSDCEIQGAILGTSRTYYENFPDENPKISINNCNFYNNDNPSSYALFKLDGWCSLNVTNTTVYNNTGFRGVFLYADSGSNVIIDNLTAYNNTAKGTRNQYGQSYGSGIGIIESIGSKVIINNSLLFNNSADYYGSAVYSADFGSSGLSGVHSGVTIINTTMHNNKASQGGAIAVMDGGTVTLINSTIENNTATLEGGAVSLLTSSNPWHIGNLISINSKFKNNTAVKGGAVYNHGNLTVLNSTIENNTASEGNAIYSDYIAHIENTSILYHNGNKSIIYINANHYNTDYDDLYAHNASFIFDNNYVLNNTVKPGNFVIQKAHDTATYIRNNIFINNTRNFTDMLLNDNPDDSPLIVKNNVYINNSLNDSISIGKVNSDGTVIFNVNLRPVYNTVDEMKSFDFEVIKVENVTLPNGTVLYNITALNPGGQKHNFTYATLKENVFGNIINQTISENKDYTLFDSAEKIEYNQIELDDGYKVVTLTYLPLDYFNTVVYDGKVYNVTYDVVEDVQAPDGGTVDYLQAKIQWEEYLNEYSSTIHTIATINYTIINNTEAVHVGGGTDIPLTFHNIILPDGRHVEEYSPEYSDGEDGAWIYAGNYTIKVAIDDDFILIDDRSQIGDNETYYKLFNTAQNIESYVMPNTIQDIITFTNIALENSTFYSQGRQYKVTYNLDKMRGLNGEYINIPNYSSLSLKADVTTIPYVVNGTVDVNVIINDSNNKTFKNITVKNGVASIRLDAEEVKQNLTYELNYTTWQHHYQNITSQLKSNGVSPTKAYISIYNIANVNVTENVTIKGQLRNEEGYPIPYTNINIYINGIYYNNVTTDKEGNYEINYTTTIKGEHIVNATYPGTELIEGCSVNTTFNATQTDTVINFEVSYPNKILENYTLNGTLLDINGNPLKLVKYDPEANPIQDNPKVVLILNNDYEHPIILEVNMTTGEFKTNITSDKLGINNITIYFNSTQGYADSIKDDKIYVEKIKNFATVDVTKTYKIGDTVNITGQVFDEFQRPIKKAKVTIKINDTQITTVETNENGTYKYSYVTDTVGRHNITVNTTENSTHKSTMASGLMVIVPVTSSITVNTTNPVKAGNHAIIQGILIDENGKDIENVNITVKVGKHEYKILTAKGGKYSLEFNNTLPGNYDVKVIFEGNQNITGCNNSARQVIEEIRSYLEVQKVEDTIINKTTNVIATLTDDELKPLSNQEVTVTVNNKKITTKTDKNGNIKVPVTSDKAGINNITITYLGNSTITPTTAKTTFKVDKKDSKLNINTVKDTTIGKDATITGRLVDQDNKPIRNKQVTVTLGNITQIIKTDNEGNYQTKMPTNKVGTNPVTVQFNGDEYNKPTNAITQVQVNKKQANIKVEVPTNSTPNNPGNITVKITDETGKPVPDIPVNITVNNKTIQVTTDSNGEYKLPLEEVEIGTNTVKITAGNEDTEAKPVSQTFKTGKDNAKITINTIKTPKTGEKVTITGKLTTDKGKAIKNEVVTVKINNEAYTVKTDNNGNYNLTTNDTTVGLNNVTVTYANDKYNPASTSKQFNVLKLKTIVTIESVNGTIGEDITLTAHIMDEKGNPVNGGNIVFKLNGRSLRLDGRFDTNNTSPMKLHVENGIVTFTLKADLYLRAGKNITASYSGSSNYESAKANVAQANIRKRTAKIEVSVSPNKTKQNRDIEFIAKLTDITGNARNTTCLTSNANIILKINGVTLKDENNTNIKVPVTSRIVSYIYHVPSGTGGVNNNGDLRNYKVEAVYDNPQFYPNTRNTTHYNVQKSIVNINFQKVKAKNNYLTVQATLTDYENNYLVGTNKICLKINGKTYKQNGKVYYASIRNGKVNLKGLKLPSGTKVKSLTIVAGERQPYYGAKSTTTDILTS